MTRFAAFFALAVALLALVSGAEAQSRAQRIERARALSEEGVALYERGDFPAAVQKLLEAQRSYRSPDNAFNIARVFERMGDVEHGVRWFRIYLEKGTPDAATRGDIERRISALEALAQRQRDQIFAAPASADELTAEAGRFFERGVAFFQRGRFQQAFDSFSAAAQFAPVPEIFYNAAVAAERARNAELAREFYRRYLEAAPNAPDRDAVEAKIAELRR